MVIHELGHAIGFHHEQSRPDRDDHVTILKENILKGMEYNFGKYSEKVIPTRNISYDYTSVMHYGGKVRAMPN